MVDPLVILILVAANGYAADLAPVACCLSRDPDLWGYLSNTALGTNQRSWLEAAAALGHRRRAGALPV